MGSEKPPPGETAKARGRPKSCPDSVQASTIVNCARQLFVRRGYGSTTTDDIAAKCRISKHTLYRFFPSKPALFGAVVETHRQKWLDLPRQDDDVPVAEALAKIFMIDISDEADQERIDIIRLVLSEGRSFPELAEILKTRRSEFSRAQLAVWLEQRCQCGELKLRDPLAAAQILMDMIFGAIIVKNIGDLDWPGGEQRRAHIRECVEIFLHGVSTDRC